MPSFRRQRLRELLLDFAALVWPTACVGCGAWDRDCCDTCLAELREPPTVHSSTRDGVPCFVAGHYDGSLRAVLVAFKHDGRVGFGRALGTVLRAPLTTAIGGASGSRADPTSAPLIVTIPSRPGGVRRRGYRHLEVLVAAALQGQRIPSLRLRALRTTRGRVGQVGLSASERERNARRIVVRRSMRRLVHGRSVVLVDDIITTGASMRAAREVLEHAGASVVAIVALCAAERRDARGVPAKSRENF